MAYTMAARRHVARLAMRPVRTNVQMKYAPQPSVSTVGSDWQLPTLLSLHWNKVQQGYLALG